MKKAIGHSFALLAVSFGVLAAGCERSPSSSAAGATVNSAPPSGGEQAMQPAAGPPATPPTFALAETPDDKLGTVAPGLGLKVGDKAPALTLDSVAGGQQSLADLYAQGPTYVVFYRGGWCPFCNIEIHNLSSAKAEFEKIGVKLVAISVDLPTEEAKTQAKHGVPFPMLSDPKLKAHQAFHVVHAAPEPEQKALAGFGIDLTSYSGESHKSFAVPSIFLVDKQGTIRFAHVDEDYKTRPSVKQMVAVAERTLKGM